MRRAPCRRRRDVSFALLFFFFLVAYGFSLVLDAVTVGLEEFSYRRYERPSDRLLLFMWGTLGSLGYRQLTVLWRLRGVVKYMRRNTDWGTMTRRGFGSTEAAGAERASTP